MVNDNEKEKEEHFKNEPESEALYGWLDGGGNERIRIADKTSSFCCGALVATLILIFTNAILIPDCFHPKFQVFGRYILWRYQQ